MNRGIFSYSDEFNSVISCCLWMALLFHAVHEDGYFNRNGTGMTQGRVPFAHLLYVGFYRSAIFGLYWWIVKSPIFSGKTHWPQPSPSCHRTSFWGHVIFCSGSPLLMPPAAAATNDNSIANAHRTYSSSERSHQNHCHHSAIFATATAHSHRCLLSEAAILARSGPPSLPPILVCGRHPCHLL